MAMLTILGVVAMAVGVVTTGDAALRRHSLLYGMLEEADRVVNASWSGQSDCLEHLGSLRRGIEDRELWALKMLDASGSPGSGFLWGNNYWMGSQMECLDLHDRSPIITAATILREYTPDPKSWPTFPVEFYMATFRHNSTRQVHIGMPNEDLISVGLCLPAVCAAQDMGTLLRTVVARRPLLSQDLFDVDLVLEAVRSLREDNTWLTQPKFIITAVVLVTVLCLMVAGTVYDIVVHQPRLSSQQQESSSNKQCLPVNNNNNINNNDNETIKTTLMPIAMKFSETREQGGFSKFLMCFSVYTNTGVLLDPTINSDSVGAIHGLRFMGMGWILMVHTVFYLSDFADNKPLAFRMGTGFMVQVISNSTLSTDTFFCLSGFLVSYMFYQARRGKKPIKNSFESQVKDFGLMILRRFLRLTPAYMIILGIVDINMSWRSRTSIFHMTERPDEVCSQYWWRNFLYINNFFSREEMCMSWSWYLSNDMQFFVIGSFLLVPSTSCMALSASILAGLVVGSSLLGGFISYSYGYVPTIDQQFAMLNVLYDPPWMRIGPYLVGMVAGYLVVRLDGRLQLNRFTLAMLWTVGSLCNVCVLFGLYDRNISPLTSAIYVALSRTIWGVGIAWILVACCTNNAGFINRILSFPAWVPLSRLTFCAYLLNPLLISSIYLSSESPLHVGFLVLATFFFGHLVTTYFCAYVASLAFETPIILLMRQLIRSRTNTLRNR